jgi:hypothetical protein
MRWSGAPPRPDEPARWPTFFLQRIAQEAGIDEVLAELLSEELAITKPCGFSRPGRADVGLLRGLCPEASRLRQGFLLIACS